METIMHITFETPGLRCIIIPFLKAIKEFSDAGNIDQYCSHMFQST